MVGLDKGRECLKKWGFRRCEDICWIKTNKKSPEHNRNIDSGAIFQRTKVKTLLFFRQIFVVPHRHNRPANFYKYLNTNHIVYFIEFTA